MMPHILLSEEEKKLRKSASQKKWVAANLESFRRYQKRYKKLYRENNKELCASQCLSWYRRNKVRAIKYVKAYQLRYPEKVVLWSKSSYARNKSKKLLSNKRWRNANPGAVSAMKAFRRAQKIMATPKWASSEEIKKIYDFAKVLSLSTGISHHVDHVYPLKHKLFCGLHVEWNLRAIPAEENLRKHNFAPTNRKSLIFSEQDA